MCAAISSAVMVLHKCQIAPYNTERLHSFLDDLHRRMVPTSGCRKLRICDCMGQCHFTMHMQSQTGFQPIQECLLFSSPLTHLLSVLLRNTFLPGGGKCTIIGHMTKCLYIFSAGCRDILTEDCQGWIKHAKRFYPVCIGRDNIRCNMMRTCCQMLKIVWIKKDYEFLFLSHLCLFLFQCNCVFNSNFTHLAPKAT